MQMRGSAQPSRRAACAASWNCHRRCRQRDVGVAEQELAAAQARRRAVSSDGTGGLAVVDAEAAAEVFGGDAAIRRIQAPAGQRQRALPRATAARPGVCTSAGRRACRPSGAPSAQACASSACAQASGTRVRSSAVIVGAAGIAVQREAGLALRQHGIGAGGRQRHDKPQRLAARRAQFAVAAPACPGRRAAAGSASRGRGSGSPGRALDARRAQAQVALLPPRPASRAARSTPSSVATGVVTLAIFARQSSAPARPASRRPAATAAAGVGSPGAWTPA